MEIDHPLHSPPQSLNPEHSIDCQFLFFIDHWEIMFTITENIIIYLISSTLVYIYTERITMCPPGYHHNGFMATPELGHRMYGYTL